MSRLVILTYTLFALLLVQEGYAQKTPARIEPAPYIYSITPTDSLKAYVFSSEKTQDGINRPAVVIFHGGGWAMGSATWAFGRARDFAKRDMVAVAAEYRLSDQKSITPVDAMKDAREVIIWMRKNHQELNIIKDSIVAYGWSAGAHLAASAAVFPSKDKETGFHSKPNALILYSPALWPCQDNWFKKLLLNEGNPCQHAPAEHINGEMPPSIIVVGKDDTVTPVEQSRKFHQEMLENGNESYLHIYKDVGHLFTPSSKSDKGQPNPDKETVKKANNEIMEFLKNLRYIK
jgi:acetyl esterase/lipase